ACLALAATTPHCAADGSCVGCRDTADCTNLNAAFCDGTTHACRGCNSDSECPSLVCDLTPGSTNLGRCIDTAYVFYVDGTNGTGGNNGLTPATPVQKIQDGLNKAAMPAINRLYVHVAAGSYNESV